MSTPTVDKRGVRMASVNEILAESDPKLVGENYGENSAPVSENGDNMINEGAPVPLTPEELEKQEQAPVETDDGTEAQKLADQQAQMEQDEAALRQMLQEQGPCVLLRFEHGNSLSYLVTPGQGVSDRALLAACEDLVSKIKVAQARELWYNYDEREAEQEALAERLSLPGQNRAQRRAKRFAGRK